LSSRKRIAQATFVVVLLNVVSKLCGFVREQMIAVFFGATAQTDAYVMANRIPTIVTGFLSGPLSIAFLPVFASYLAKGDKKAAARVTSSVVTISTLLMLAVSAAAIVPAPALVKLIAPGFSGATLDSAVLLTRIFFPAMVLPLIAAYAKQVLNTYDEFTVPAVAPVLQNLVIIAAVSLFGPVLGVKALAGGVVAGYAANLLIQIPAWRKKGSWPSFSLRLDESTRKVFALSVPLVAGNLFSQVYLLVEVNLASHLPAGSIAALNFADRMRQVPVGLFVTAVTTVIYPSLSAMWARKDSAEFRDTALMGLRYVAFICIPAAVGLMVLAEPAIRLAFQYGAFTGEAVSATGAALLAYSPGLVALAVSQVIGVAFYSAHETRIPVMLGIGISLLNALFDVALVRSMGHVGLALANTLAAGAGAVASIYVLSRFIGGFPTRSLALSLGKILAASLPMGASAYALARLTGFAAGGAGLIQSALAGGVTIGGAVAVFLVLALILKCEEMTLFMGLAKDKLGSLTKKLR
jgi:putative peptidoglycan lipid II flippase